jgi:hypothetical protein
LRGRAGATCVPPHTDFIGSGECEVCIEGKPTSGTVSIHTLDTTAKRNCKIKRVSGTLEVNWNDGSTSTGELAGKPSGSRLKLAGALYPVDPIFPSDPLKVVLNNYLPNPCVTGAARSPGRW